jgi:hypothetical protein
MSTKAAPWAKLWWDWYATRSHVGLSGIALALGPALMLLGRASKRHCDASGDACGDMDGDGVWIVTGAGKPVTAAYLASVVRFSVPEVEAALAELVESGTLIVRTDKAYGFPNFWRYQETAAAARTRKYRSKEKRHSDGHGDASRDGSGDDKRTEVRGQSVKSAGGGAKPSAGLDQSEAERVATRGLIRREFSARYEAAQETGWTQSSSPDVDTLVTWLLTVKSDRSGAWRTTLDNFFADPFVRSIHFSISHLAKHPDKYRQPREIARAAPNGGMSDAERERRYPTRTLDQASYK